MSEPPQSSPLTIARDAALLALAGWRMAREDPAWLAVQAARRVLPGWRSRWAPSADARGLAAAVGAFVADQPERAAELLRARGVTGRRWGDGLAARIAVQVGAPDALAPAVQRRPRVRAALDQQRGALSAAAHALTGVGGAAAVKVSSELAMLQPGFRLPVPDVSWPGPGEGQRVLHVLTNSLPHTRSGYTSRTHHLLRACVARGIAVEAVTRIGYPATIGIIGARDADVIDGVTYRRLQPLRLAAAPADRLAQQVEALLPIAQRFRPTVLHTTTDYTNALVTQSLADALGVPWVYEMRGQLELTWVAARPDAYRADAAESERVTLLRSKEAELATAADAVVALSEVQRADLVARGVPEGKIVLVPNAINEAWLERTTVPADARAALGLPREGVWVGTVSSLVAYEGLDDLLRAVALLRAEGLDVRVSIAGDGVSRPSLVALAGELGLGEHAVFPGRVPPADAVHWYEALDVFVVPRRDTPVCRVVTPLKPVEAMALGRPVVLSDLPALTELLGAPRVGGVAIPEDPRSLADVLSDVATDSDLRARWAGIAREHIRSRTWATGAGTLSTLYGVLRRWTGDG